MEINQADYDALMGTFTSALDNDINTALAQLALHDVLSAKHYSCDKACFNRRI